MPVSPQIYQTISTGEQFLLFDSGLADPDRLFIFGSTRANRFL